MLIEKLSQIAEERGFDFNIGDEHWQNLLDGVDDVDSDFEKKKVYMLVFSDKESAKIDGFGGVSDNFFTGVFLLAVRSRISDFDFNYKYEKHIKPLKELWKQIRDVDFTNCEGISLKSYNVEGWRENYLDTNLDCLEVRLTIENNC